MEKATFAAGCFWGVEETFRQTEGVVSTSVGYTGGQTPSPTYEQVCSHATGHAEAVEVEFDPAVISFDDLLNVFWSCHNPTTLDRQGPDIGNQYRSAIYYHTAEQMEAATHSRASLDASDVLPSPIVTEITPASEYYRAEEYHQQYLAKRGAKQCH